MFRNFRDLLAIIYLPVLLIWILVMVWAVKMIGVGVIEAFGLGTATGILLAAFTLMWQFYFRKAGGNTPSNLNEHEQQINRNTP